MKKILLPVLVIAAMSSCSKATVETPDAGGLKEIRLGSGITARTKAAYSGDVAIAGLQFLRLDAGAPTNDFSGCTAIEGNRAVGGAIVFGNKQYYAAADNTYFASYFPEGIVNNGVVTWSVDGKTDIMTAGAVDAGTNDAPHSASLAYEHRLAQIEVVCKAAIDDASVQARWGNITGIKLRNTPATVRYAYNGLEVTPGDTGDVALAAPDYTADFAPITVPASTNDAVNAAGMFYPSASQSFQLEIATATEGIRTVTIDLGAGNSLEHSRKHVVTLTFQAQPSRDEITVSSTVEEWTPGATGSGSLN